MSTEALNHDAPAVPHPEQRDRSAATKRRLDEIARAVLAAFEAAVRAGKDLRDCYVAGVDAWHDRFPDSPRCEAAKEAVAIILDENYPDIAAAPLAARGAR